MSSKSFNINNLPLPFRKLWNLIGKHNGFVYGGFVRNVIIPENSGKKHVINIMDDHHPYDIDIHFDDVEDCCRFAYDFVLERSTRFIKSVDEIESSFKYNPCDFPCDFPMSSYDYDYPFIRDFKDEYGWRISSCTNNYVSTSSEVKVLSDDFIKKNRGFSMSFVSVLNNPEYIPLGFIDVSCGQLREVNDFDGNLIKAIPHGDNVIFELMTSSHFNEMDIEDLIDRVSRKSLIISDFYLQKCEDSEYHEKRLTESYTNRGYQIDKLERFNSKRMLMKSEVDILLRTRSFLKNGFTHRLTISLALCYLFKTNFLITFPFETIEDKYLTSLISYLPEIKDNFEEIIAIANDPQNCWIGNRQIIELTQVGKRLTNPKGCYYQVPPIPLEKTKSLYSCLTKVREWYQKGQIGASSSAICNASLLQDLSILYNTPEDKYDMDRCILLVKDIPELESHISALMKTRRIKLKLFLLLANVLTKFNPWSIE